MDEQSANRGFLILSIAGVLTKFISVFYIPLLQRILGLSGYGIYQNCYEVFLFAYAITNLGTQPAIAKVVAELTALERHDDAIRTLTISKIMLAIVGGVISVFLMVFAFTIGDIIENPEASYGILMLAPSIFVTSILSAYRGYFQGKNSMTAIAISQVAEQVINIIVSLTCAFFLVKIKISYGSAGGTIGTSVGALIACFYMMYVYKKIGYEEKAYELQGNKKPVRVKTIVKKLFKYGLPITLSAGLQNFGSLVDMVNVNKRLSHAGFSLRESQELYGILGRYKTLISVPLIIITSLAATVLPSVSAAMVLKDRKQIRKSTEFAFKITFIVIIPSTVGLSCLAEEVFSLIYGTNQGYDLMMIGAIVLVFMSVVQIQTTILQSMNKLYYVLATFVVGIIAKIITNYILVGITSINILGVIAGNFLWFFIPMILNQSALKKSLKVKIHVFRNLIKPLVASAVMGFVIVLLKTPVNIIITITNAQSVLRGLLTLLLIIIGGFVYIHLLIFIGGIKKKDLDAISGRIYPILPRYLRKNII